MKNCLMLALALLAVSRWSPVLAQGVARTHSAPEKALAYLDLLAAEKFDEAFDTFDAEMAKVMPSGKLKQEWNHLQSVGGKLKSKKVVKSDKVKQGDVEYEAVIVACEFEKSAFDMRLVYSPNGKLSGMFTRPAQARFVGKEELWLGELNAGLTKLRILIHLGKNADKKEIATFDSLDQGQKGLAFDVVSVTDNKVRLESTPFKIVYEGTFDSDHKELKGTWKQNHVPLTLNLKLVDVEPTAKRPQTPQGPFPYDEFQVTYASLDPEVKLAGTLTVPKGAGSHPAVILITGSGAQDRDETIFSHKPFWVIADFLTRRGIAVLRVDDRGVGGSTGPADADSSDFAKDVQGGIAFLKTRKEIDPQKIGLLGHSEGGLIALMVAAESNEPAFLVLLASSAVSGKEILFGQGDALLKAAGATESERQAQRKIQEKLFEIVAATKDNSAAQEAMKLAMKEVAKTFDEATAKSLQENEAAAIGQLSRLTTKWFRFFLEYDPGAAAEKVTCPVLALNGSLDLQVLPGDNLPALRAALTKANNKDFEIREYPKLNHLFQTCETGQVSEYGRIEETIAPQVLEDVAAWISKRMLTAK
jgi:uncharacterized protein